jgi:hypothetical protein
MALIADRAYDAALSLLQTEVNRLDICSAEPTSYAQATSTLTLGLKVNPTLSAPADRTPNGRKTAVSAITNGSVTATGTATHWALSDTVNSRLLAAGPLQASQAVTSGNVFTLNAFDVGLPDAA